MDKWDKAKIENSEKDRTEVQFPWSATLWWNLGKTGSKLQEGHDCNLGQPKPYR